MALTNNFAAPTYVDPSPAPGAPRRTLEEELEHTGMGKKGKDIKREFNLYIESAVVGMR